MTTFEQLDGAVVDGGVLQHVGNPIAEQRLLSNGRAVALRGDRAVIAVGGEDRLTWLETLSSQSLAHLAPGEGSELLILDPQGRIEHVAAIVDDGVTAWLIVDAADLEGALAWLLRMRFRLRVDPVHREDVAVVAGVPSALESLDALAVWRDPWPAVGAGGWAYAADEGHPGRDWAWAEAVILAEAVPKLLASDTAVVGVLAADALRIAAWRPAFRDVDERALPHEFDWLRTAVHLSKGCYRGQETVAKVHNLGHPPRRLVMLSLDGSDGSLPSAGDDVRAGDAVVGRIVAAARHHEDGPVALALVRRSAPLDAVLLVDSASGTVSAAQEVIVPADAGATVSVPRLPRLGRRAAER